MKLKTVVLPALLALTGFAACKGDDPEPQTAGKGGAATLRVIPKHHDRFIDSCMVYIKYNASNLPSAFDDSARCVKANPGDAAAAVFSGLKAGKYYLYGAGWDPLISDTVVGGLGYTIHEEVNQTINIYITEGD